MVPAVIFAAFFCLQTASTPLPSTPAAETGLDTHLAAKIAEWLPRGEHQDIPWKVKVQKPIFTFQQRNVVKVTAEIDARELQAKSVRRNLTFVIKVADEHGNWLPGENYVSEDLEKPVGGSTDIQMESEVLLQPGKYTLAAIAYDSILDQYNLSLNSIVVDALKKDPFPELFKNAAPAEFVRGEVYGEEVFSPLRPELLLHNKRPLQIDLIVDMSSREHQVTLAPPPAFMSPRGGMPRPSRFKKLEDKTYTLHLLQTASILGSLHPQEGCVRVSSLDVFKKQLFEPTLADKLDWRKLYAQQVESTRNTISVNALENRRDLPKYFVEAFDSFTRYAHCVSGSEHVVIVLSHGLHFPDDSQKVKLEDCSCKLFYLRQNDTAMDSDDLKHMLSPLSLQILEFHDALQFRKRLAELIERIDRLTQ